MDCFIDYVDQREEFVLCDEVDSNENNCFQRLEKLLYLCDYDEFKRNRIAEIYGEYQ